MMEYTPAQRKAVETTSTDTLVIAGAGSGKTATLIGRIAHLLKHGASPSELLVLTFTRKAAGELIERLEATDRTGMLIGTFHSVALTILREHGDKLGYNADSLTVLEPDDADMLLKQVCRDLGYVQRNDWKMWLSWKRVKAYREYRYRSGNMPGWLKAPDLSDRCGRLFAEYCDRCFHFNALDFGLILSQCRKLLAEHDDVLAAYHSRIKHVLLDESQDADLAQYDLHEFFAPPATFFGVGDRRQTIYRWRGARPDLMIERHPNAEIHNLNECFRCGDAIVEAANNLIAHNAEPHCEPMVGRTGRIGGMAIASGRSKWIIDAATGYTQHGYGLSDIVILARSHRVLKRLARVCSERDVPYYRVGSRWDVCDTEEFKALHAALRLCVNPRDDPAFMRITSALDVSAAEYARIRSVAAEAGCSHWHAYFHHADCSDIAVNQLACRIADAKDDKTAIAVARLRGWRDNCWSFEAEAFWVTTCGHLPLADALRWFALRDSQDDIPQGDHLTLMTVHAAKGLEWPVVFVCELNEGGFPSSMSLREDEGVYDERRLCYVAMTRTKKRLVLHYRKPHDQSNERKIAAPSRFLEELRQAPLPAGAAR